MDRKKGAATKENAPNNENKPPKPLDATETQAEAAAPEATKAEAKASDNCKLRIVELEKQIEDAVLTAQRLQAEFDNFRKRNAKIRLEAIGEGAENVLKSLLITLDSFDRALENMPEDTDDPFVKGVELVYKQLLDALKKHGLSEVDSTGAFDPNLHEAIMQDESGEYDSGMITAVLQKGYKVNDHVIRHTMVKVAK